MSVTPSTPRPNQKNLAEHPHYFGAFLNIARHNAYMVMVHLSAKYETEDKDTLAEDAISQAKLFRLLRKNYNKPDVTKALIRDLKKYFPFLNYPLFLNLRTEQEEEDPDISFETDPEQLMTLLQNCFTLLNDLRNNFSHYVCTIDYSRIDFTPIRDIYQAAVFRLTDRGKHTKRFDVFEEAHIQHLLDPASVYQPKVLTSTALHENTIAFIACLFLERKYAFPFLSRLGDFQLTSEEQPSLATKATREAYTMFCCRLPQPKLESSDILLDMVNELGRCPAALYTVLSEEDRSQFHVQREVSPYLEYDEDTDHEALEQEVILKRHDDRFPYFALRYFDDTHAFPSLRFDVYLGKWRTKPVYEKVIYAESRERLLTKPIHTFARLGDILPLYEAITHETADEATKRIRKRIDGQFVDLFREDWITKDADGTAYLDDRIERFAPHYNLGSNVIALKFLKHPGTTTKNLLPKAPTFKAQPADAIISTHELRGLFLYDYLSKTPVAPGAAERIIPTDTETFIQDYIDRIKRFFRDVKEGNFPPLVTPPDYRKNEPLPWEKGKPEATREKRAQYRERQEGMNSRRQELGQILDEKYGLALHQIPSRLKEYLLAYKVPPFWQRAKQKFQQQQDEVKTLLKDLEKGRSPRVGEQATWLAEDIIFLTPPTIHHDAKGVPHPQKLNNDQFRVLQSSLAYFSANRQKIITFLREETSILGEAREAAHPFLHRININACGGILDFYEDYLLQKAKWLRRTVGNMGGMNDQRIKEKLGPYLPASVNHKPATDLDYTSLPVYLPRGLFDQSIAEALAERSPYDIQPTDKAALCLAKILEDDSQAFYELKHWYRSILSTDDDASEWVEKDAYAAALKERRETVRQKKAQGGKLGKDEKLQVKNEYKDLTRAKTRLLDREQHLRSVQADDRALWLMVQQRQAQRSEHLEIRFDQLKLHQIESILREPVHVSLAIPDTSLRITDELPLRRYGDLRRVAKDRRLANLARYYEAAGQEEIPHDLVKQELERYDRRREAFFATIYHFEQTVHQKFGDAFPHQNGHGYFAHHEYVKVAVAHSSDQPFNLFFREQVADLRNKFSHNEFPWYDWLYPEVQARAEPLFADRVFAVAEAYYQRMLGLI